MERLLDGPVSRGRRQPMSGYKINPSSNSLFWRENTLFFEKNSLLDPQKFPVPSRQNGMQVIEFARRLDAPTTESPTKPAAGITE